MKKFDLLVLLIFAIVLFFVLTDQLYTVEREALQIENEIFFKPINFGQPKKENHYEF